MKLTIIKFFSIALFIILYGSLLTSAQKIPSVQVQSFRAPSKIKVDGNADEWQNKFEAYNRSTDIFYTLANDQKNIYLVIQAKDPVSIKKIIAGGITFRINATGKRDSKAGISLTYASVSSASKSGLGSWLNQKASDNDPSQLTKNDSLARLMNSTISRSVKEIKLSGVGAIADTLLSVYNEYAIKTALQFDKSLWLTCEMAIPLKYLDFITNNQSKLYYQVMLNGLYSAETTYIKNPRPNGPISVTAIPRSLSGGLGSYATQTINYSTDFWGEYTLAQ